MDGRTRRRCDWKAEGNGSCGGRMDGSQRWREGSLLPKYFLYCWRIAVEGALVGRDFDTVADDACDVGTGQSYSAG